jgi:hypothetical protein
MRGYVSTIGRQCRNTPETDHAPISDAADVGDGAAAGTPATA